MHRKQAAALKYLITVSMINQVKCRSSDLLNASVNRNVPSHDMYDGLVRVQYEHVGE
jgi:hypothetical protein